MLTSFRPTVNDPRIQQTTISANRYLLNTSSVSNAEHLSLIDSARAAFHLANPSPTCQHSGIGRWMHANSWVEPTLYDHVVPAAYVTPIPAYDNDLPWLAITWCYDPLQCAPHPVLKHPTNTTEWFGEKDEVHMMKSMLINHLEIGWICYCDVDGMILVHHLQQRGTLKYRLPRHESVWLYRYMIQTFVSMLDPSRRGDVVLPTNTTLDAYADANKSYLRVPSTPYTSRVLQPSGFVRTTHQALSHAYPKIMQEIEYGKYVSSADQTYWKYDDNSHTLAN